MRPVRLIVLHCSDSPHGDARLIDQWHRARGFDRIGYHFVILNGFRDNTGLYLPEADGLVETGRPLAEVGAHVQGYNRASIGICLIGGRDDEGAPRFDTWMTPSQLKSLRKLLGNLRSRFPEARIAGHRELNRAKSCPNFDWRRLNLFPLDTDTEEQP